LSQYHYLVSLNEADDFRWLQVAAEDGNPTAEYSLGSRLRDSDGPQDKLRACFWFKQAKVNGSEQVVALATRQLDALDRSCTSN
jgi:TPR repeat protein